MERQNKKSQNPVVTPLDTKTAKSMDIQIRITY